MRHLLLFLVSLFVLQGCDSSTDPNTDESKTLSAPTLISPINGQSDISTAPVLSWNAVSGATHYLVQISTRADFTAISDSMTVDVLAYQMKSIAANTQYYWHVRAIKGSDASAWSETRSFTATRSSGEIRVGAHLTFEDIDMETAEKDSTFMEIVEQGATYKGKTNVTRVFVTHSVDGSTNELFFNYESNGNFSMLRGVDPNGWLEMPFVTKQDYEVPRDSVRVGDGYVITQVRVRYIGSATVAVGGVPYAVEQIELEQVILYYDSDGELNNMYQNNVTYNFSAELNFLTGGDSYNSDGSSVSRSTTRLIKIEY